MQTYQPNDQLKTNSKIIFTALVVSWIIIGVGIWRVFFRETPEVATSVDTPTETTQNAERRYIGEKILLAGDISKRSGFGLSTHMFQDTNGNEFGVRSQEFNLSNYEGEVQIKGEVVDFDKETPIISVQDIIKESKNAEDGQVPAGNENFRWSEKSGLGIDLSVSTTYNVSEIDGEVRIVESTNPNEPLLTIQPFECKIGDPLQDCADLQDKFTRFGNQSFTNAKGVTFYNLTETNTWFVFDLPNTGYSLRSSVDNSVSGFADLIQIINTDEIEELFASSQEEYCRSLESRLETLQSLSSTLIKPGLLEMVGVGSSETGEEVTCMIYGILGERNSTQRGYYNDESTKKAYEQEVLGPDDAVQDAKEEPQKQQEDTNPSEELAQEEQGEDTPDSGAEGEQEQSDSDAVEENEEEENEIEQQEALAVNDGVVPTPASLDGRLQYSSVRGFDMYFSKQGVSYVGELMDTAKNFGMNDASCAYKVNVIAWKEADNVSILPDLAVYQCTGTAPSAESAKSLNIQLAGTIDNGFFVVERYTNNLGDIKVYVE